MIRELIRRPATKALFSQIAGGIGVIILWKYFFEPQASVGAGQIEIWILLGLWGLIAAAIGSLIFKLPIWWILINACFPITLYAINSLALPAWLYLTAFLICLAVFWNAGGERVPLYLTNRKTWQALHDLLHQKQQMSFIDIGCGIGGTIRFLATNNPDVRFEGVENAPIPFAISWLRQSLEHFRFNMDHTHLRQSNSGIPVC
ncbi:MAG: hypothetical protein HON65_12015 [Rhodospirillales bacterium]|nr:hypothetical protein [Rhodospirillales bacterium]